ncbi:MAG: potassium transporter Kup, partial [Mesorhizobium sp.]
INLMLALVVMLLVVGFGESSRLASAYGISVTGNMLVTNILLFVVMTRIWKWPLGVAVALMAVFAFVDTGFFAANIVKVFEGGWSSLA